MEYKQNIYIEQYQLVDQQLSVYMMHNNQHKILQSLDKIQLQLNQHLKKLNQLQSIAQASSSSNKNCSRYPSQQQQQQFFMYTHRQVKKTKQQLNYIISQYEQSIDNSSIQTKYNILKDFYHNAKQNLHDLKQEFLVDKTTLKKCKKLQTKCRDLQNQWQNQQIAVNKLQHIYNNSIRLESQMVDKLKQLDNKQRNILAKFQAEQQKNILTQGYIKDSERYNALTTHKQAIEKHINYIISQNKPKISYKTDELQKIKKKIEGINEIYKQMEMSVAEQQLIINQIMLRQNVTGQQLLQAARLNQNDGLGMQHEIPNNQQLMKNISKLKYKNGLNSSIVGQKQDKYFAFPIITSPQQKMPSPKTINQQMKLTTKIFLPTKQIKNKKQVKARLNTEPLKQKAHQETKQMFGKRKQNKNQLLVPITHIKTTTQPKNFKHRSNQNKKMNQLQSQIKMVDANDDSSVLQGIPNDNVFNRAYSEGEAKQRTTKYVRIRTKAGYVYKKQTDSSIKNYTQMKNSPKSRRQSSQIVILYDKLSNYYKKSDEQCLCESQIQSRYINSRQKQEHEDKQKPQIQLEYGDSLDLQNSGRIKLPKNRKKRIQSKKNIIQSRQSDGENKPQSTLMKKLIQANRSKSNNQKNEEKVENDESLYIRRRLNTIHQKEEQSYLNKSFKQEQIK